MRFAITNKIITIVALLIIHSNITAQYQVKSPYMIDSELTFGFIDSSASFWFDSYDETLGGFYTDVNRQGAPTGSNKNMLTQTRNAYGMVRAFMMTGNDEYLEKAEETLEFMYNSAWDETNGGWYGSINQNGDPANPNENKTAFNQHYALLGILAYYEATGDTVAWNWFNKGYDHNELKLWDTREQFLGYYDYGNSNWSTIAKKSFNATVDAVTTHLLNAYLLTSDEKYRSRLIQIADNIINRLASTLDNYAIGFVESFDSDWGWHDNTSDFNTRTIMGHVLKAGWVLGRIHQVIPNEEYVTNAEKFIMDVWENGYDHIHGGPFKDYDRLTGEMFFYGQDTAKAWWQVQQAIVAGLQLYDITKNDIYLEMADESLDFFMKYFVDHTYGEIFADLFSDGSLIPAWGTNKGNGFKAGYHSIETGYYTYLYGSLFYNNSDVTLTYKYYPVDYDRSFTLYPLAINKDRLKIKEVTLDGNSYTDFIAEDRVLNIPAGMEGKFTVTFGSDNVTSIASNENVLNEFELSQNYPNPFNPTTTIRFTLSKNSFTTIKIYDVIGREVKTLIQGEYKSGSHEITFNGSEMSSGFYFYTLVAGNFKQTKKMVLLK